MQCEDGGPSRKQRGTAVRTRAAAGKKAAEEEEGRKEVTVNDALSPTISPCVKCRRVCCSQMRVV